MKELKALATYLTQGAVSETCFCQISQANSVSDMAHLFPRFLLFLLWGYHGHLSVASLLRACTRSVFPPSS